jgi:hypothetical protein
MLALRSGLARAGGASRARMLSSAPKTLFDKIWASKVVDTQDDGTCLIYIDRHLVHEVTSPQAFEGLRNAKRGVRRVDRVLATADHNVPTSNRAGGIANPESKLQVDTLGTNCKEFGLNYFGMGDERQGVVHIIGPEQGFTLPGMTIVCGDSHTATHGAFGALAFGIGTSEVEHVLATQTLVQKPAKNMRISVEGDLPAGITSKDLVLHIIGVIGTAGGTGHVIEYEGPAISKLSMEVRASARPPARERGVVCLRPRSPSRRAHAVWPSRLRASSRRPRFVVAHDDLQHVDRGGRACRHDCTGPGTRDALAPSPLLSATCAFRPSPSASCCGRARARSGT